MEHTLAGPGHLVPGLRPYSSLGLRLFAGSPTILCVLCLWVASMSGRQSFDQTLYIHCPILPNCSLRQTVLVQEAQGTGFHVQSDIELLTERCH